MTTFTDGPAQGETLWLKRAPRFLRVVQNGPVFDALDQLGDEPEETELIYVYEITGLVQGMITSTRGVFPIATYRHVQPQPADYQELRDAVRNLREVKGRLHTKLAAEHLINLLPDRQAI